MACITNGSSSPGTISLVVHNTTSTNPVLVTAQMFAQPGGPCITIADSSNLPALVAAGTTLTTTIPLADVPDETAAPSFPWDTSSKNTTLAITTTCAEAGSTLTTTSVQSALPTTGMVWPSQATAWFTVRQLSTDASQAQEVIAGGPSARTVGAFVVDAKATPSTTQGSATINIIVADSASPSATTSTNDSDSESEDTWRAIALGLIALLFICAVFWCLYHFAFKKHKRDIKALATAKTN